LSYTGSDAVTEAGTTMLTTMDPEAERHRQIWLGFVRFMKIMITVVVLILVGMAVFLL
jgi:hypothetical protein